MTRNSNRVAVVTDELAGLNKGGGIGTCAYSLVRSLIDANYCVTLIITDPSYQGKLDTFLGCDIIVISDEIRARGYEHADHVVYAFCVHQVLCEGNYGSVHFNDWRGSGYFFATAKRQGLVAAKVITHTHGPHKWVRQNNFELTNIESSELDALEKGQIENSDMILSPSQYLVNWYKNQGYVLPTTQVINWQLPAWLDDQRSKADTLLQTKSIAANTVEEIIFFGRHERRKGFQTFLKSIGSSDLLSSKNITFVGRFDRIDREFTGSMAFRLLEQQLGAIRFFNTLDHTEAMHFISGRENALVVMPSEVENSPCTVGECFTIGVPFVATSVGGTAELFSDGLEAANLAENTVEALTRKLEEICKYGLPAITSTLDPAAIKSAWENVYREIDKNVVLADVQETPKVSVCLIHYNRPNLLRRALAALNNQTYENFEVILVDDGSRTELLKHIDLIEQEEWRFELKVIRSANNYLGAARNLAAASAEGEFLIFHDDDNIAEPNQIETFVRAALTGGYDQLTSQYLVFESPRDPTDAKIKYFPIGVGGPFSFFRNRFGDANALIRKSTFDKAGGFTELRDVGWEDWELFLKCYALGARQGIVPFPLFRYRANPEGMLSTTAHIKNVMRVLSVTSTVEMTLSQDVLEIAIRDDVGKQALDQTWTLLGRSKHGAIHQELMALDPNSDFAREKLMELALALGRYADAIELGLGLQRGFHRVIGLTELLSPRAGIQYNKTETKSTLTMISTKAVLLKGWIDFNKEPLICSHYYDSDGTFDIVAAEAVRRDDVNEFLGRTDNTRRGFAMIAALKNSGSSAVISNTGQGENVQAIDGRCINLSSDDLRYGNVSLAGQNLPEFPAQKGFLDHRTRGQIVKVEFDGNQKSAQSNQVVIKAPPGTIIYLLGQADKSLLDITLDLNGEASIAFNSDDNPTNLPGPLCLRLFTSAACQDLSVTLHSTFGLGRRS